MSAGSVSSYIRLALALGSSIISSLGGLADFTDRGIPYFETSPFFFMFSVFLGVCSLGRWSPYLRAVPVPCRRRLYLYFPKLLASIFNLSSYSYTIYSTQNLMWRSAAFAPNFLLQAGHSDYPFFNLRGLGVAILGNFDCFGEKGFLSFGSYSNILSISASLKARALLAVGD